MASSAQGEIFILGINGGKKGGHTAQCISLCLREAERRGAETELIDLVEYDILPITKVALDPEHIKYHEEKSADDMPEIYKKVLRADGIVFGTPVHWFSTSTLMKIFLDRLTSFENANFLLEGKVAGFIVYGDEAGKMSTLMQLAAVSNHMGMFSPPYALIYFDKHDHEWPKKDVGLLAKNMVNLIRLIKQEKISFDYD